ncbi:MAG: GNAT family N-acetyltransferase [Micrococcales bacterium]|nr:GNAT family N-acetyltransferase [Microbacteriaceae bacterium]NBR23567.1 GNAT family N-acetyltransferase [Micrococcales bacterium]NBX95086.1 GNAT family N-acetyltransferase [Actinomycetota bacterium]NBR77549.1 GNAT family N-acetyltransferase [Microbacteriaceae bacterium]NBS60521.1 GNAT family N-acetyltransferase [Microbacteriaceae bacterium]
MTTSVRQVENEDKSSWQELYGAYLKFYESESVESSTELLWNRLIKDAPEIQGLVAVSNGEVVGIAHFHYQISTWSDTSHCYLEDLYVAEDARGKGVASALIAAVEGLAIQNKSSELFWITKENNTVARKLYEQVATLSDFVRYEKKLN